MTVAWMWNSESMCHSTGNRMNQDIQSDVSDAEKLSRLNASLVQATVSCRIVVDT